MEANQSSATEERALEGNGSISHCAPAAFARVDIGMIARPRVDLGSSVRPIAPGPGEVLQVSGRQTTEDGCLGKEEIPVLPVDSSQPDLGQLNNGRDCYPTQHR